MIFQELSIAGVFLISLEKHEDERGFFARSFCKKEFAAHGLWTDFVQCNLSYNKKKGTLRGIHYQKDPYAEIKVVSCMQGAIYDVALDVRQDSFSFGKWLSVELSSDNHCMLYLPKGIAHGFQTLEDDTAVYYQMGTPYRPEAARGIKFNDPKFSLVWPIANPIMSVKDGTYSLWNGCGCEA